MVCKQCYQLQQVIQQGHGWPPTKRKQDMNIKFKDFEFDVNDGFAWASLELTADRLDSIHRNRVLQACLVQEDWEPGQEPIFLPVIDATNCGHDDGICGDINNEIFYHLEESKVMEAFFDAAKRAGLKILNQS